jgi:hypothetical protein
VLQLCDGLSLPRGARNALLQAAGFAPLYPNSPLDGEALAPLRAALTGMMRRHAPFPALLCDRHWTLIDVNAPAAMLLEPLRGGSRETNLVRLIAESPAAETLIVNWREMLEEMAARLRVERADGGEDRTLRDLTACLERAMARLGGMRPEAAPRRPLVPLVLRGPARTSRCAT